jgi:hypothetical protein
MGGGGVKLVDYFRTNLRVQRPWITMQPVLVHVVHIVSNRLYAGRHWNKVQDTPWRWTK